LSQHSLLQSPEIENPNIIYVPEITTSVGTHTVLVNLYNP
jgi:hypothetical protein